MDAHTFKTSFSSFNGGGGEHVRIQFHIKNKMKKKRWVNGTKTQWLLPRKKHTYTPSTSPCKSFNVFKYTFATYFYWQIALHCIQLFFVSTYSYWNEAKQPRCNSIKPFSINIVWRCSKVKVAICFIVSMRYALNKIAKNALHWNCIKRVHRNQFDLCFCIGETTNYSWIRNSKPTFAISWDIFEFSERINEKKMLKLSKM